jgi:hypothetical protein
MSVSVKTNQLTGPASTGNNATTDPGFQPKALIVWNGLQTATGAVANAQWSLGMASDAVGSEGVLGTSSVDAAVTSAGTRIYSSGEMIRSCTQGTTTDILRANVNAIGATGFTLNWTTLGTASPLYNYLALGGADITNAKVSLFQAATVTGPQAVTGVGFRPDVVLLYISQSVTDGTPSIAGNSYSIGAATASNQWATGIGIQNAAADSNTRRAFYENSCVIFPSATGDTIVREASLTSMDADGFTLNWTTVTATGHRVIALAIKGGQWKVGTETQKTSTGTKATTGVGFTPKCLILSSHCSATTGALVTDAARLSFGTTTGTSNNVSQWMGDVDNAPVTVANTIMSVNKCIVMATEGVLATPTTNAEAALSSFDADGFTLDWTTADATARVFGYVALGDTPPSTGTGHGKLTMLGVG